MLIRLVSNPLTILSMVILKYIIIIRIQDTREYTNGINVCTVLLVLLN